MLVVYRHVGDEPLVAVRLEHGLGDSRLHNLTPNHGTVDRHQSRARAQAAACGEDSGPHHPHRAGEDESRAVVALMAEGAARMEQRLYRARLDEHVVRRCLLHYLLVEVNVQHLPLAQYVGVILEHEA